jgi:hypothetical protein
VVYVTNRPHVDVWLLSLEFLFCHPTLLISGLRCWTTESRGAHDRD